MKCYFSDLDMDDTVVAIEEEQSSELGREESEEFVVVHIDEASSNEFGPKKPRKIGLWLSDAVILCIEHMQMYALILSLSLGWPWPREWIKGTSFAFLFNLDLWEFTKIYTVYTGVEEAIPDSSLVPFSFLGNSIAWILAIISVVVLFTLLYVLIPRAPFFATVDGFLYQAKLVRLFTLIAQLCCFPFGLALIRLLVCQNFPSGPENELFFRSIVIDDVCWSSSHLGVLLPMLAIATAYFIVLPCWMIYTIRKQLLFPWICTYKTCRTHENNLRLKEAEYVQGLDITWELNQFSLFASFRRPWVWFRPFSYFFKAILLISYGILFNWPRYQTIVLFALVCVVVITVSALPVYRLRSFNLTLVFSVAVNICNLVLGILLVLEAQSSLLLGTNLNNALIVINVTWLLVAILWFVYLLISNLYFVKRKYGPLWPTLNELNWSTKQKSDHTLKYFNAVRTSRQVLERCYSGPSLFAPVHDLSKQIQIVNAYCREAEVIQDPTHARLWALVNEMIDVHNYLSPHSVYNTNGIPPHVQQLLDLILAFSKRLEQRESDLILWVPRKRRILLKLFVIATFLDIARQKASYQREDTEERVEQELVKKKPIPLRNNETQLPVEEDRDISVFPHYDQTPLTPPPPFSVRYGADVIITPPDDSGPVSTTDNQSEAAPKMRETNAEQDTDSQSLRSYTLESCDSTEVLLRT